MAPMQLEDVYYSNKILDFYLVCSESHGIAVKAMAFLTFTAHDWPFLGVMGSILTQGSMFDTFFFFSFVVMICVLLIISHYPFHKIYHYWCWFC